MTRRSHASVRKRDPAPSSTRRRLIVRHTPIALGLVYGAMFVAYPTWSAVHWAYFAAVVPDHLQGRVQSIATLLSLGPVPFGVLLVGFSL